MPSIQRSGFGYPHHKQKRRSGAAIIGGDFG
jgi:hypothetical protein